MNRGHFSSLGNAQNSYPKKYNVDLDTDAQNTI